MHRYIKETVALVDKMFGSQKTFVFPKMPLNIDAVSTKIRFAQSVKVTKLLNAAIAKPSSSTFGSVDSERQPKTTHGITANFTHLT